MILDECVVIATNGGTTSLIEANEMVSGATGGEFGLKSSPSFGQTSE